MNALPRRSRKPLHIRRAVIAVVACTGFMFAWLGIHELQKTASVGALPQKPAPFSVQPKWPGNVEAAAIGAEGYGVLATNGNDEKRPIASIAKVITALSLLHKYPMKPGEQGPEIPITAKDEQIYRDYIAQNGTVVLVKNGTPIHLRDALEAMLLPSANNIADTAAIWGFGSLDEYHQYANDMLRQMGLKNTQVGGDASGLNPATQSTASDLVRIGEVALQNPVIAEIVASPSAEIPTAGPIPNYNALVTKYGFTGIKPGDTLEAGITSLFSTTQKIDGEEVTLIGVVLGAGSYRESNNAAIQIVDSTKASAKHKTPDQVGFNK